MDQVKRLQRKRIRKWVIWGIVGVAAVAYLFALPSPLFDVPYSTAVYARNGELIGAKVATDGQWRFRPQESLPDNYIRAVLEYEDRRFHKHPGVSAAAIARAVRDNLKAGKIVSGGSTLTMQLVRLSRGNPPRTFGEKLLEMILATRIECSYTKEEILELYAAHAPFGGNVVGLEAATWRYFGHSPSDLSWAEAATLAVLPNSPSLINPSRGREQLQVKRDRLLQQLFQKSAIDSLEYSMALMEPLPGAPVPIPQHAPHLVDRIPKGRSTVSTLNYSLQQRTQEIVDNHGRWALAANQIRNAAVLVANVRTGEVLAYVGNLTPGESGKLDDGRAVDIIQSRRSTGSLLKPILYGALLSEGQILPNTLIYDTPINLSGFSPSNYNKTFSGVVPARVAVERSLNVPIVRMLNLYNNSKFLSLLRSMGLTTFDRSADHYGATLILGGAEGTLWEMSGMYASLARSLESYLKVGSYQDEDMHALNYVLDEKTQTGKACQLSPSALWFMFEAMSGVNRPEEEASWQEFSSMKQIAWKTGTSYGNRDAWAIGLTPDYLVGVWVGNANGEGRASMTGVGYAAPILFDIFSMLPTSFSWFNEPLGDMEPMSVCRKSGHRASEWCISSGDAIDTLDMPRNGVESPLCPYHKPVTLAGGQTRGWFVLPPSAEYYYRRSASDYTPPPTVRGSRPLELIYPQHEAVLYLPRGFNEGPRQSGQFVFQAAHRFDTESIHWHLDNHYLGSTDSTSPAGHTWTTSASAGDHVLTIVDNEGNRQAIRFTVARRK